MKAGHVQNEDGSNYNLDNNTTKDVEPQKIFTEIDKNLDFLKYKYNALICNDVIIREFSLLAQNIEYKAFVMYIDGMVDSSVINEFILSPLMMRNRANIFDDKQKKFVSEKKIDNVTLKNFKKSKEKNLVDFIYNSLIPQNSVDKVTDFSDVYSAINMGNCMLFVDSLDTAFN